MTKEYWKTFRWDRLGIFVLGLTGAIILGVIVYVSNQCKGN